MNPALLIFIKNPELGKVKTRLAATMGDRKALEVFRKLLVNIHDKSFEVSADKLLFYSSFVDQNDIWENDIFHKHLQIQLPDLGQRMLSAFEKAKEMGYSKALIVGSDIYEVSTEILNQGFEFLENSETVLGPSHDGGYYAIGFNFEKINSDTFLQNIFLSKTWSHENVANEALEVINSFSYACNFLPILSDIDTEDDLKNFPDLYNIL
ncbi:MAG: TIGR04282 family arsenosugar biosynthesis glycosyltransferase [Leadbetterella sp.]|nr:TIGR04282 family arsenosugar biosynthesis glycosyltransferase [Leadbetterella sp.]